MGALDSPVVTPARNHGRHAGAIALSLVQLAVGYEWLVSGLSKLVNGDFPHGLAAELSARANGATPWYGHFLRAAIVPHAATFGYLIEFGELGAGIVLVAVAFIDLAGVRLPRRRRLGLQRLAVAALAVGIVMVVNFELANGGSFGLRLASDSFDEGVDLDSVMVAAQLALIVALAPSLRRSTPTK